MAPRRRPSGRAAATLAATLPLLLAALAPPAAARPHTAKTATLTSVQTLSGAALAPAPAAQSSGGVTGAPGVTGQGDCVSIAWTTLARSGKQYGSGVWGLLKSETMKDIIRSVPEGWAVPTADLSTAALASGSPSSFKAAPGYKFTPAISNCPDIPTFHNAGGKTYIINHFEEPHPSTMYISEVASDSKGNLRIVDTTPVPSGEVGGLWFTCSGTASPWDTHLGSEEFPPDCRLWQENFAACQAGEEATKTICRTMKSEGDFYGYAGFPRFFGYYPNAANSGLGELDIFANQTALDGFRKRFKCYNYGGTPEVSILPGGSTKMKKWFTLGRISHETALVMPDNRTVYTTDDASNGVLLKFVADKPQDLGSGALYAARLSSQRTDAAGKPTWDVAWVELGRGKQSELERLVQSDLRFYDIFEAATPSGSPLKCPGGFSATNFVSGAWATDGHHMECLKVKPGMETAAAFLESRRLAAMKGATTEWEKTEGITFSRRFRQVYFATAKVANGMTKNDKFDLPGKDDISLPVNRCGAVWVMEVDSSWSGDKLKILIAGEPTPDDPNHGDCHTDGVSEPDNVHYIAGNLLIQEDTDGHTNNVLWAYNLEDGSLTRLVSAPPGAEVSGVYANRAGGALYLTMTAQHPLKKVPKSELGKAENIEAQRGYMGYLGPIPLSLAEGPKGEEKTLKFQGIPAAIGDSKMQMVGAEQVCSRPADAALKKPKGYSAA